MDKCPICGAAEFVQGMMFSALGLYFRSSGSKKTQNVNCEVCKECGNIFMQVKHKDKL